MENIDEDVEYVDDGVDAAQLDKKAEDNEADVACGGAHLDNVVGKALRDKLNINKNNSTSSSSSSGQSSEHTIEKTVGPGKTVFAV